MGKTGVMKFIPWAIAATLLVLNVATLTSERVHIAAHNAIASVVGLAGASTANAALANSPVNRQAAALRQVSREVAAYKVDLHLANEAMRAENARMVEMTEGVAAENDRLRAMVRKRADSVKKLTSATMGSLAIRTAKQISSLPAQAVPYLGIAVQIAVAGYQISEDCVLARSISDLVVEHDDAPLDANVVCKYVGQLPSAGGLWESTKNGASFALQGAYAMFETTGPGSNTAVVELSLDPLEQAQAKARERLETRSGY